MATVHFTSSQRQHTGGLASVSLPASTVSELLRALDQQFPGLQAHLADSSATAVAIDGDIVPDPLHEPLHPNAEVHLVRPLAGG